MSGQHQRAVQQVIECVTTWHVDSPVQNQTNCNVSGCPNLEVGREGDPVRTRWPSSPQDVKQSRQPLAESFLPPQAVGECSPKSLRQDADGSTHQVLSSRHRFFSSC